MLRIRIHYAKTENQRYTGALDLHKVWERSFRRAHLPVAFTQGFHPQPRFNQACPLPMGMLSLAEVLDVWLDEDLPLDTVQAMLQHAIAPGLEIQRIESVDLRAPSLQTQTVAAHYQAILLIPENASELLLRVNQLMANTSLMRIWRSKNYDLRPLIQDLTVGETAAGDPCLEMTLAARESATGRPEEVLSALQLDPFDCRVVRTALFFLDSTPTAAQPPL